MTSWLWSMAARAVGWNFVAVNLTVYLGIVACECWALCFGIRHLIVDGWCDFWMTIVHLYKSMATVHIKYKCTVTCTYIPVDEHGIIGIHIQVWTYATQRRVSTAHFKRSVSIGCMYCPLWAEENGEKCPHQQVVNTFGRRKGSPLSTLGRCPHCSGWLFI